MPKKSAPETQLDPARPHLSVEDLEAEARAALVDEAVRLNRETSHRAGGNTTEPGVYEEPTADALAPAPVPEHMSNEDNAENVAAMDAQVAASTGADTTHMTTGVETSAPAKGDTTK